MGGESRITRRALVGGGAASLAALVLGGCSFGGADEAPTPRGGSTIRSPVVPSEAVGMDTLHLLRRVTYGLTPGLLAEVDSLGVDGWLAAQLEPRSLDRTRLDALLAPLETLSMPPDELFAAGREDDEFRRRVPGELIAATTLRQLHSPAQLEEQMVEFWTNHFNIVLFDGPLRLLKPIDDREVIRPHALGRFEDLLIASAQSPAMLVNLDNAANRKGAVNENYGRELLELHTVGVDGGYSESDILPVANTLTGWSAKPREGTFQFRDRWHDTSPQQLMDWRTPDGATGLDAGIDLLRHLAHHPSTARHLARKLLIRFVGDEPDDGFVDDLAATYLASDTEITAVLRELFNDRRFTSTATPKFRRPFEYLIAAGRALDVSIDVERVLSGGRSQFGAAIESIGQVPMSWPAPNGYPDTADAWMNTATMVARWSLASDLGAGAIEEVTRPGLPAEIDDLSAILLGEPLEPTSRSIIEAAAGTDANAAAALVLTTPRFQFR